MSIFTFVYYLLITIAYITEEALSYEMEEPKAGMKRRTCVFHEPELKDLFQSDCCVDKSLIIKDFLNMGSRIVRVTAPRGFGKTVNMKILKAFLRTENGLISSNQTEDCSLFIKHNLNIFKSNSTFFNLHCGKSPVIFITFKKTTGNNLNDVIDSFRNSILKSYLEHEYLLNSTRLHCREKLHISRYILLCTDKNIRKGLLEESLVYLSEMLYVHFDKKVTVLIDDFEAPFWTLLSRNFPVQDLRKTIDFIKVLVTKFLENNRYVERCLINDCLQLSSLFFKNTISIVHLPFLENHPLVMYYGLTDDEVREKLNYFNILDKHKDVKDYYNGYRVQDAEYSIYSTWSVMNYLETEYLIDYCIDAAGLDLRELFSKRQVRRLVSQILAGKNIRVADLTRVSPCTLINLKHTVTSNFDCTWMEAEFLLLFLSDNGYFTATRNQTVLLKIPNREIYHHLAKKYGCKF